MTFLLSLIAFAALTIALPIYGTYIYDRIKNDGWVKAGPHVTLAVITACGVFALGWWQFILTTAPSVKSVPKLEFLRKGNFEQEEALHKDKALNSYLQMLKVKFDEAEYAQIRDDLDHAIRVYEEIDRGSDENGSFHTFSSACVKNNEAVAYFHRQDDRGFKASKLLFAALALEPKPRDVGDVIQRNLDAIDHYVNQ
jgi:hypothetical protein